MINALKRNIQRKQFVKTDSISFISRFNVLFFIFRVNNKAFGWNLFGYVFEHCEEFERLLFRVENHTKNHLKEISKKKKIKNIGSLNCVSNNRWTLLSYCCYCFYNIFMKSFLTIVQVLLTFKSNANLIPILYTTQNMNHCRANKHCVIW